MSLNGIEEWRPQLGDGPERYERLLKESHRDRLVPIGVVGIALGVLGLGIVVLRALEVVKS